MLPDRLASSDHPCRATRLEGKPHRRTHRESVKLLNLLDREGHSHGRHETRDGTVVQGHGALELVHRDHAAVGLETGLGMPKDGGQAQMAEKSGRQQQPAPRIQPSLIHC